MLPLTPLVIEQIFYDHPQLRPKRSAGVNSRLPEPALFYQSVEKFAARAGPSG